ncbi:UBN2 domain-containing protein, partial [Cephalotus follicularis]
GPEISSKIVDGLKVPKLQNEFDELDYTLLQLNAKAKHVIFCALSAITYEGTNQVKDTKINKFVHEYELFAMIENEDISSMYARFNDIINALKGLGKFYPNHELVSKILRCLPKSWEPKVTAI